MSRAASCTALAIALAATPARAHHGVAAIGVAGVEGPGAAIETTSALPLGQGTAVVLARTEYADFLERPVDEPQKLYSSFTTLLLGYGLRPWLTAYVLQPYAVKAQETLGTSAGLADPTLMLALSFKDDDGLRLAPEKESLDDLEDWHFQAWAATTVPLGSTTRHDTTGSLFEPEMQSGFGAPSVSGGLATLKQLGAGLTWLGDVSRQHFFAHDYEDGTRYQFGAETRVNTALSWRTLTSGTTRVDLIGELNGLKLERDREGQAGSLTALGASGGVILYGGAGARLQLGRIGASLAVKRAMLRDLNEESEQQGSEGLERFRASASIGFAFGP